VPATVALILAAAPDPAKEAAPEGGGFMTMLPLFAMIFLIFYFLVVRPQGKERKKREALLQAVKKNDEVVTTAGLHGTVVSLSETTVVLKVDDGVRLKFDRSAIWQVRNRETEAAEAAAAAAKDAKDGSPKGSTSKGGETT